MDVIYPYKAAPFDLELRYSLRSLVNLPHDRVIIAGDKPMFCSDRVLHVAVPAQESRYQSSAANILAACEASDSDHVVVMNDDIFLLEPWRFQHENRGTIRDYLNSGKAFGGYRLAIEATLEILQGMGIAEPLFFGLHTPTVYRREVLMETIRAYSGQAVLLRTLYHNLHPQPSVTVEDVKLHSWPGYQPPHIGSVLSISDEVATSLRFRKWISERLPHRSPYEREGRCLILGHGPTLWDDLAANWGEFDAVIASPEAAVHWCGPLLAIAHDDEQALTTAQNYGFDQPTICGATGEVF